jgi:hypothetical protein
MKSKIAIETQVLLLKLSLKAIFRGLPLENKNFIPSIVCSKARDISGD